MSTTAYILSDEAAFELKKALSKHPGTNPSPHHHLAVLEEEVAELREHVYHDTAKSPEARKEAIQVAAMALRFVLEVCDNG